MKELEFIDIIKAITDSEYIGDDCANLQDLGIVVTQDSLVEGVHFKREYTTPYKLGYKSVAVNLSDIYASGAKAEYITISLSLPEDIDKTFIKEFYEGAKSVLNGAKIIGGDITGSDKIFISVTAIGSTKNRKISSRKNAKVGYKIITNGNHGSSAAGLHMLKSGDNSFEALINEHLMPSVTCDLSQAIAKSAKNEYAMIDSSDGLMDSLYKIAQASNVLAQVDFNKIPYDKNIETLDKFDYKDAIFFGGEDYRLVCAISEDDLNKINPKLYTQIGEIEEKLSDNYVVINFETNKIGYNKENLEKKLFNHF